MMDMLGSALGVLLAFVIVSMGISFQTAFMISLIPAVLGILSICMVAQNNGHAASTRADTIPLAKGFRPGRRLIAYLSILFVFCVGNSSNSFLLLKASDSGLSNSRVILVYFLFNITASIFSYPFGRLSDKIGRGKLIVPGYLLYGLTYFGFAFLKGSWSVPVLFIVYGLYTALISGAERAFIVEQSPPEYKGTVLGLYGMCQGFGLLAASLLAGGLWNRYGSGAPFIFGGSIGILCAAVIFILMRGSAYRTR
jgi:MFS family permease